MGRADFCGDGGASEDYYGVWFFRVINFTSRCNTKGRIVTSVTKNLFGL